MKPSDIDYMAQVVGIFLGVVFVVLIIYLIIRRIDIKKEENFEKRDN